MMQSMKRYVRIFHGVKIPWFWLFIALIIAVLQANVDVESATISASIIDSTQSAIKVDELIEYVGYLLALGVLAVADAYISNMAYQKIDRGVRVKLWNTIMHLPLKHYDTDNGNELVSRITGDCSSASYYFLLAISSFTTIYSAVVVFRRLFVFEATLAMWMLLIIPCAIGIGALYGLISYQAGYRSATTFAATTGFLAERVRNFRMIKACNTQKKESDTAERLFKKQFGAEFLGELSITMIQLGIQLISCLCIVIAFVVGGKMVSDGVLTVGRLVAFYSLSSVVAVNMMNLYMNFGAFTQVNGSLKKVSELFDAEAESTGTLPMTPLDEDIRFEHVQFAYGEVPVLNDFTVTIPKGKITAIIGTNGAGKTTVLKLLERMYRPDEGTIYFGNEDIQNYDMKQWRNAFGMVAQDSPLLSGTIRDNIMYGTERTVSEEELIEIAKAANIYDLVMSDPKGFDRAVDSEGSNFSGGQRQCIAIARALMRDSRYLLLDEATSNLDATCENCVCDAFERLMKGRTAIMIAHSYQAIRNAEYIIVMKDGAVEATGTPEELLKINAFYQTFVQNKNEVRQ